MNQIPLFLIFILLILLSSNFTLQSRTDHSTQFLNESSENRFNPEEKSNSEKKSNSFSIKEIAHALKVLLTESQLLELIRLIEPYTKERIIFCKRCSQGYKEDNVPISTSKELYENIISQNLSNIPIYELIHVPELLSNATHLRTINNRLLSPRPVRPRRHFRPRNPSNIPGTSPYVIHEITAEMWSPLFGRELVDKPLIDSTNITRNDG